MQLTKYVFAGVMAGLTLALSIAGCDQTAREADKPSVLPQAVTDPAPDAKALKSALPTVATTNMQPVGDVRLAFIAMPQTLLDIDASVSVLAASNKTSRPKVQVKGLDRPTALAFAPDGKLYFLTSDIKEFAPEWIGAIAPGLKTYDVVASATQSGYVLSDKYGRVESYESLTYLSYAPDGKLLTIASEDYPRQVNLKEKNEFHERMGSIPFTFTHPSGEIKRWEFTQAEPNWDFNHIQADKEGRIVLYSGEIRKWQRYKPGGKIEEVSNVLELPTPAYLVENNPWDDVYHATLAPDGYIYAVQEGKGKQDPDRVIRIGDPGQSSLRKEASRVVIAEFKHGELTGALAFSPKGALAVGAKNTIYLISPATGAKP